MITSENHSVRNCEAGGDDPDIESKNEGALFPPSQPIYISITSSCRVNRTKMRGVGSLKIRSHLSVQGVYILF